MAVEVDVSEEPSPNGFPEPIVVGSGELPASPQVRLVSVVLQINAVADDGYTLRPLQVQPIAIAAPDWDGFSLEGALADLQDQIAPLRDGQGTRSPGP